MLVSRNISEMRPNIMAVLTAMPKDPAFGRRHITATAQAAPTKRYGILRPKRVHVLSLSVPMIGCTMIPISGGSIQKYERLCGSAPSVEKMREMLALCNA